jgi:hypothetical protein
MKTIENVTLYKCDFCKKELKRKHSMVLHETICLNNPINHKACMSGCKHLDVIEKNVWFETGYDPDYGSEGEERKVTVFQCNKIGKLMYPFSIERKDLPNRYPSTFEDQEPMPKKCDSFEVQKITSLGNIQ